MEIELRDALSPVLVTATLLNTLIERCPIGANGSYINLFWAKQNEICFLWEQFGFHSDKGMVPNMDHSVYAPSQCETALQCNTISHCLGAYTKWSLPIGDKSLPEQIHCHMTSLSHTDLTRSKIAQYCIQQCRGWGGRTAHLSIRLELVKDNLYLTLTS